MRSAAFTVADDNRAVGEALDMIVAMYEALNRGDGAGSAAYLHPEAELHQPPELPDAGSYVGKAEFIRGIGLWLEGWEEFRFEPSEIDEEEDGLVVLRVRLWGKGKDSGIETKWGAFHVWSVREGKAYRCVVRVSREEALEDARRLL
jgi:ketosteroid isomerase-like protein